MFNTGGAVAQTPVVTSFLDLLPEAKDSMAGRVTIADRRRIKTEELRAAQQQQGFDIGYQLGLEEGSQIGHAQGFSQAFQEASEAHAASLAKFKGDLQHTEDLVFDAIQRWYGQAEEEVEKLVLDIARQVLRQELTMSRESVTAIVKSCLGEITLSQNARIRVNPLDLETLSNAKEELIAASATLRSLEIVDDPSILGGCVIESAGGVVDASVEGQLDRLEAA